MNIDSLDPGPRDITREEFRGFSGGVAIERASMNQIMAVCEGLGCRALRVAGLSTLYYPFDSPSSHLRGSRGGNGSNRTGFLDRGAA